jgi:O-antigen biosynthesis protein
MDLSIIIVNYNVREFLDNALVSISKAARGLEHEIYVVDNASDDGSVELIRSKFPGVKLIVNESNLGFARANNLAIRKVKGTYLLLINPDTIVQENTLHVMVDFFEKNPDVGMAGCKILNPDGKLQIACRRSFPTPMTAFTKIVGLSSIFPNSRIFSRYNLTYLNPDETYEVDAISGSFMMLRRTVYETVGGFDEDFFMYGEDLDWCYRIQKAGWKIFYVHSTQIIHYKGESTKRSDLDEIGIFYQAMHLFVKKHLSNSWLSHSLLRSGIVLRTLLAFLWKAFRNSIVPVCDIILIDISQVVGEFLWIGRLGTFPHYAYPIIYIVPPLILVVIMYFFGVYTERRHAISRTFGAVAIGFMVISALVFFFKDFGFSRAVTLLSFGQNLLYLPGWRLLLRLVSRSGERMFFGRRTLIVGTSSSAQEVLRKVRMRADDEYDVVGFVDINRQRLGEQISGINIVGSIDNIGKIIRESKITDVIFSTDTLSYGEILSVIGRSRERTVNFRLVPNNLEVIIGKTHIDHLDDIPLVEIDYNIDKSLNRLTKRAFDILLSVVLLISIYPFVYLRKSLISKPLSVFATAVCNIPLVLQGRYSFVGRPVQTENNNPPTDGKELYLGKIGLTGIVQMNTRESLSQEEIERYNLYYAKNQSLSLDIEILLKSLLHRTKE